MNYLPNMRLSDLSVDTRALLYFHIRNTEQRLTGAISNDETIPYVKWRNKTLSDLSVGGVEVNNATQKFGGMGQLIMRPENCLLAIQKSLKGNAQRATVRNLLWNFMDELEFDMRVNSNEAYSYKWDLVNQIIKDKLFG